MQLRARGQWIASPLPHAARHCPSPFLTNLQRAWRPAICL